MSKLFTSHLPSLQVAFSDLKRQAIEQPFLLTGTPGSVTTREVSGREFFYRQYYDPQDRKSADYIGSVDDPVGKAKADQIREQIGVANALLASARLLSRGGYVRVDARTDAILVALANNELFRAGALLVGSHAYGALLNDLGARTAGYATEDIDVARDRALGLAAPKSFEAMLAESKLALHPVPQLDRKKPSTSFKPPGADRLRVDLLAPTAGESVKVLELRELEAHATGLPYFRYVLQEPIETVVLGRSAVIPVKVPRPERLAWHKMLISELRARTSDKKLKDIEQAAVLFAVVAEREPGALEEALNDLPRSARAKTKLAAKLVLDRLQSAGHERATDLMKELIG
jgi:hypothetical protein